MHPLLFTLLFPTATTATVLPDSTDSVNLRQMLEVEVTERTIALPGETEQGRLYWNLQTLEQLPHLFGTADPMRFLQMLPGVATNNDYTSGLHIQGCSTAHHLVELAGAPVFNASHLLGLFSVFTPSHFRGMALIKNQHDVSFSNHLGGHLTFYPTDSLVSRVHLNATVSFMESEGTLALPTGNKSTLYLSGRGSFLNLLYKDLLKIDEAKARYTLQDYNLTYILRPNPRNKLNLTFYHGQDRFFMEQREFIADGTLRWGNTIGSLEWEHHADRWQLQQTAYITHYNNTFGMNMDAMQLKLNTTILQSGYKNKLTWNRGKTQYAAGMEYTGYALRPMHTDAQGIPAGFPTTDKHLQAHEEALFVQAERFLTQRITVDGGLRLSLFHHQGHTYADASPRLTFSWQLATRHRITLHYGLYRQYLHQVPLANGSFPIDYRIPASPHLPPETAHSLSAGYYYRTPSGTYELSAEVYYKHLANQPEYNGAIFDLFGATGSLDRQLMKGKGNNYGIDIMLKRNRGLVTGWLSYTLGRSDRRFPATAPTQWFPSAFDRRHDLAAVASYRINRHWSLGGNFVFAGGIPYTQARQVYLINNNPVCEYGKHNGARLASTHRLDLSATYRFKPRKNIDQRLNFSLFNVYAHENELFRYMRFHNDSYSSATVGSLYRMLPSVGYTLCF